MQRAVVSIVASLCWIAPASAGSVLDFSKPQTGKSRSVINADGTPAEMGVPARTASRPGPQSSISSPVPDASSESRGGVPMVSTSSRYYGGAVMNNTGYTRSDGSYAPPIVHTEPYRW
jgi:hypothetical protein